MVSVIWKYPFLELYLKIKSNLGPTKMIRSRTHLNKMNTNVIRIYLNKIKSNSIITHLNQMKKSYQRLCASWRQIPLNMYLHWHFWITVLRTSWLYNKTYRYVICMGTYNNYRIMHIKRIIKPHCSNLDI